MFLLRSNKMIWDKQVKTTKVLEDVVFIQTDVKHFTTTLAEFADQPLEIIFEYDKQIDDTEEYIFQDQPIITSNTSIIVVDSGWHSYQQVYTANDSYDFIPYLNDVGLLDKQIVVYHRYTTDANIGITYVKYGTPLQTLVRYIPERFIKREIMMYNSAIPSEIQGYLDLNPIAIYIRATNRIVDVE